jgi:hypothetical protein
VGDEAATEQERINPSSVRPLAVIARHMPRTCTRQCEPGCRNLALINRSIVSPVAITDWPQMDQLSSDIADDMNAEKLPIVPTTSFTKPSVLVPVQHSTGRPHSGRTAATDS